MRLARHRRLARHPIRFELQGVQSSLGAELGLYKSRNTDLAAVRMARARLLRHAWQVDIGDAGKSNRAKKVWPEEDEEYAGVLLLQARQGRRKTGRTAGREKGLR